MHTTTRLGLALCLVALGCSSTPAAQPTTPPPAPPPTTPVAEVTPAPAPAPEATPEPPPAPAAFVASAEDRTAWQHATTLLDYNARANFHNGTLTTGFTPDPWPFALSAGGGRNPIDVASLGIRDAVSGDQCTRSSVTRRPDFHFTFAAGTTFPLLRFYVVTGNGADATLLINGANGEWRCNDDHHHDGWGNNLMPVVDFHNPPAGRYEIWVGSYDASHGNPAQLFVTELDSNHP
jgi:hypothetical protein